MLSTLIAFLALSATPAHATQITNLPTHPELGSVTYRLARNDVEGTLSYTHAYDDKIYLTLTDGKTESGGLTCVGEPGLYFLTAMVKIGGTVKLGNFQFDSMENCMAVGEAIKENPGRAVTFRVNLRSPGQTFLGQVVQVIF